MIRDEHFWGEAPIYALHYDVHGMFALAEAALRYDGTDLYHYESPKSGASLKKLVDGYLRMAFPLERTGTGSGGSSGWRRSATGRPAASSTAGCDDTFLDDSFLAVLEVAYKRYHDEGYAWVLSLDPDREAYIRDGRPAFSYVALTHGETAARPAPAAAGAERPVRGHGVRRDPLRRVAALLDGRRPGGGPAPGHARSGTGTRTTSA